MEFFEDAWPFTNLENTMFSQKIAAGKNRLRILGLIARRRGISQRQLVLTTGHQPSTISNIVRTLKEQGVVREGATIETERMGPKETELEVPPDCLWCAGVGLDGLGHRIILVNASGHTIAQEQLPPGLPSDTLPDFLAGRIHACAASAGLAPDRFGGVGVSVPGVVDTQSGMVLISRSLDLHDFPLGPLLRKALDRPVWIERNVACGAYAEYDIGVARQRDSFIYFFLRFAAGQRAQVGLSLVIGEKVFQGSNSAAGEVDSNLASVPYTTSLAALHATSADTDAFYDTLAKNLIGIVNLLDISCVVFSCNDEHLTLERFQRLGDTIASGLIPLARRRFEFLRSSMGAEGILLGAARLALHRSLAARLASIA
ncbi:ROK family transcriptional regulator [Opitutaceae bacterium TAV5]|nr:ROK family transcriptional regulator [Opitutaceae bacterium TAV5]